MIELSIVLAIVAVIATISIPAYRQYQPNINLGSSARMIASDLRQAQQNAVSEQIDYQITFNQTDNSYQLTNSQTGKIVKSVVLKNQISITDIFGLSSSTVRFNATGAASEQGLITITNNQNSSSTIEIKPSGYVKITNR